MTMVSMELPRVDDDVGRVAARDGFTGPSEFVDRITAFVLDDHPVMREGLREVFHRSGRVRVVGEAGSIADATARLRATTPQVAVVDLYLPDGSGAEVCAHVRETYPDMGVLVLTGSARDDNAVFAAIDAGASGVLLKGARIAAIIEAIETIARGGSVLDPSLTSVVMNRLREPAVDQHDLLRLLTDTEQTVLAHLAAGRTNRDIANQVCLSESAVKKHVTSLMRKIHVQSRTEAAVFALRAGVGPQ